MKNLNNYIVEHLEYSTFPIIERLHINKDSKVVEYAKTIDDLCDKYKFQKSSKNASLSGSKFECNLIYPKEIDMKVFYHNNAKIWELLQNTWKSMNNEFYEVHLSSGAVYTRIYLKPNGNTAKIGANAEFYDDNMDIMLYDKGLEEDLCKLIDVMIEEYNKLK